MSSLAVVISSLLWNAAMAAAPAGPLGADRRHRSARGHHGGRCFCGGDAMADVINAVDIYVAVSNEADVDERRRRIRGAWAPVGTTCYRPSTRTVTRRSKRALLAAGTNGCVKGSTVLEKPASAITMRSSLTGS